MSISPRFPAVGAAAALAAAALASCSGEEEAREAAPTTAPTIPTVAEAEVEPARFEDATADFGLDFVHTSGADGRKYLPETMGSGAALFDRDGDGDLDLFLVNGRGWNEGAEPTPGRMYDLEDGRFVDVTEEVGLAGPEYSVIGQGVCAGDYDGDGDWDMFLTTLGPNLLLENRDGRFVDVTAEAGVAGGTWADDEGREHPEWSTSAAFADLDDDGWLDLFVCNYLEWSIENDVEETVQGDVKGYASPKLYRGSSCRLYRNLGDGTFADVTESSGVYSAEHKSMGVCVVDVDGDGRQDVIVANDTQPNCLFMNRGDMRFEDVGGDSGVGYGANGAVRAGMGVDAARYAGEDELAVAIGNFSGEPISFFRSVGSGDLLFTDDNIVTGLGRTSGPSLTFAMAFLDANLDGYSDLLAINGHIEPDIGMVSDTTSWKQKSQLFLSRGADGRFVDYSDEAGSAFQEEFVGRGLALGDLDGDGDLDAVVTECDGPARVWRNATETGNHWVRVKLVAPAPNVHAVGAEVRVAGGPFAQTGWVRTGHGYLSQSETALTFGLGEAGSADVTVRWPDGKQSSFAGLAAGEEHVLQHPDQP